MKRPTSTPILDAVRRQRAEDIREGRNPYSHGARVAYPWHVTHNSPGQLAEAEKILAATDPLTLEP